VIGDSNKTAVREDVCPAENSSRNRCMSCRRDLLGQKHPEDIVDEHHAQQARRNPYISNSNLHHGRQD
jgi:hypothetical protein